MLPAWSASAPQQPCAAGASTRAALRGQNIDGCLVDACERQTLNAAGERPPPSAAAAPDAGVCSGARVISEPSDRLRRHRDERANAPRQHVECAAAFERAERSVQE